MDQITVTLPDGSRRSFPAPTSVCEIATSISPRLAKAALAAVVGDRLVDLLHRIEADTTFRLVTADSPEALGLYRHSTAHLLAAAVTSLYPGTQCGIGPATEDGFFYDFVVERPFVPEDLDAIEHKMRELASQNLSYERKLMSKEEASEFFSKRGEPLKVPVDRGKGRRRRLLLHDRRPVHRFLQGTARPFDRQAESLQGADELQCLLEGRCA